MENKTKSKIIKESLLLFSKKGYSATSVQDIANAVGIKAPSLYNHFKSKQMIFDEIVLLMKEKFSKVAIGTIIPTGDITSQSKEYAFGGVELLKNTAHTLFHYYLTDEYASLFAKMLSFEKHNNIDVDIIYKSIYIIEPIMYQKRIFDELIKLDCFIKVDSEIAAYHFFSPIFLLLNEYENFPEKENEAFSIIDKHIDQFCKIYERR